MRTLFMSVLLALGLASISPATAGPYEDAHAAFEAGDYPEALRILRPSAEQGDVDAQLYLANMYYYGAGVAQSYIEAAKWYLLAAEQGTAFGQLMLGHIYLKGEGVLQDYIEAMKWFRLLAEHGKADGYLNLGHMYVRGQGAEQDNVLAHMWFNLAASKGIDEAAEQRDDLTSRMTPAEISEAQQLAREWADAHP
jgi:TPR repeat protein